MTEPSAGTSYDELRTAIGHYLGYQRSSSNWSADQKLDIEEALKDGMNQFYNPPSITNSGNIRERHQWSFLRPEYTITTEADTALYALPTNYAGFVGKTMYYAYNESRNTVAYTSLNIINAYRQTNNTTNAPYLAAVTTAAKTVNVGSRFWIEFYPTPDGVYNITGHYYIVPATLTSSDPYPYGGPAYALCIKESCLAAAELLKNGERGPHWDRFTEFLASAVQNDQNNMRPQSLGKAAGWDIYNRRYPGVSRRNMKDLHTVTVQGLTPS